MSEYCIWIPESNMIVLSFILQTMHDRPTYCPAPRGVIVMGWV